MPLAAVVGDIRGSMLEEVDFRREAQHLAAFAAYLERSGAARVATCPGVYRQFSGQRCVGQPASVGGWVGGCLQGGGTGACGCS